MKILIFSDSHNIKRNIIKALNLHPDAQYIIHLGDGVNDLQSLDIVPENAKIICIKGNCDGHTASQSTPPVLCIEICNRKIFICHGHNHNVKHNMMTLIYCAVENNADIVLYGHTHCKHNEYIPSDKLPGNRENGLYIFNPGSISLPRDSMTSSYGLIEIKENGVLLSHGKLP